MQLFRETCAATLKDVSLMRRALRRALMEIRLAEEVVADLQVLLQEIAVNAIEHSEQKPTWLEIKVRIRGAQIGLEIIDDASPFFSFDDKYAESLPKITQIKGLNSALTACGRGIGLVRDFADSVDYQAGPPNHFIIWRELSKRQPTVLIVEDERVLAETYALGLYPTYKTIIADSVEEALASLDHVPIDLVVADYHLADGTGRTLAETMEIYPDRLPVPVILITGDRNPDVQREMLKIGVEASLQKPVSKQLLHDNIRLAIGRAERRRASHFRHFAAAASKLLTPVVPSHLRHFRLGYHSKVADLGSGDAVLHLIGDNRDRLILMDVMGHGLGAHSSAIALAAIARAIHAQNPDCAPHVFLTEISKALYADMTLGQLISTMLVIDLLEEGTIEISSAGHPPPVCVGKSGIRQIQVNGPLPGFAADADYESQSLKLSANERLVCFTDGLDPIGLSAGEEVPYWLSNAFNKAIDFSMDDAMATFVRAIQDVVGPEPDDDWTLIALERYSP